MSMSTLKAGLIRAMMVRRFSCAAMISLIVVLSGCGADENVIDPPTLFMAPPTAAGLEVLPPRPPIVANPDINKCDATASLRPFTNEADRQAAVAKIRARGRLIVGLDIGNNLFSFRDPITGAISGFDVDIAGEVARDIFGNPSRVEYRILSSAERITALQNKEVDIVARTMTVNCKRRNLVNFSTIYFVAEQRIMVPRTSPITRESDLSGKRVCVSRGTTSLERVRQISPPPVIVTVVAWADCLVALQQNQADAVTTDDSILAGLVIQDPFLHIVGPSMAQNPYGIGISLDNEPLVRFVNGTLDRIRRDGTWNTLYRKWLTTALGSAPAPPPARYSD